MALNCNIDEEYWKQGSIICGIDEVGRGAIAGPVVSCAIILKPHSLINIGIDDSKKINAEKRYKLAEEIKKYALAIGIGVIDNVIIDRINILEATMQSMQKAVEKLNRTADIYLIDGNRSYTDDKKFKTIIDGDCKSISIASASIIAKVYRDTWMQEIAHKIYPEYNFHKNKGYGTTQHINKILEIGPSNLHRMTFLKKTLYPPSLF